MPRLRRRSAPNDRIGLGLIGCGSLGRNHHLRHILTRPEFLDEIFQGEEQTTALAYCEFSMRAGKGLLKIGSDDGVAVWLNGEPVHTKLVSRGLTTDQDQIKVRFREGRNRLLLKVSQGGGGWAFCVRLADASGRPIDRTASRK